MEYLKQLRDQNKIEIEIFDELKKQTEKDISGNAHRRRKRWTDKKLWEENGKKPTRNDVEIELLIDSKM